MSEPTLECSPAVAGAAKEPEVETAIPGGQPGAVLASEGPPPPPSTPRLPRWAYGVFDEYIPSPSSQPVFLSDEFDHDNCFNEHVVYLELPKPKHRKPRTRRERRRWQSRSPTLTVRYGW